jgi:hypothetical protein
MKKKINTRTTYVLVKLTIYGFNYTYDELLENDEIPIKFVDDTPVEWKRRPETKNTFICLKIDTLQDVHNHEIGSRLDTFLRTSHFVDVIYLRYYLYLPFLSWRKNSTIRYRDMKILSIAFFDTGDECDREYKRLAESTKPIIWIPIQYRMRTTRIVLEKDEWSYIDYFSMYHEKREVKLNHFMINYGNRINISIDE